MVVLSLVFNLFLLTSGGSVLGNEYEERTYTFLLSIARVQRYSTYSSVMMRYLYIPSGTIEAHFEFRAVDKKTTVFKSKCDIRNVSVCLKHGSYPVINPDGVAFPKTFAKINRPETLELNLQTDDKPEYITMTSPEPGDYFAVSYISWTDARNVKIRQAGLSSTCRAYVYGKLTIIVGSNIETVYSYSDTIIPLTQNKNSLYKFYCPENYDHVLIGFKVLMTCKNCENIENILIYANTRSVPNENKYQNKLLMKANEENTKYLWFWPAENSWNYLNVTFVEKARQNIKDFSELSLNIKYISAIQKKKYNIERIKERLKLFKTSVDKMVMIKNRFLQYSLPYKEYNLRRTSRSTQITIEYDFQEDQDGSTPLLLNISSSEMTLLKFTVQRLEEIGGTLSLSLAIKSDLNHKTDLEKYRAVACVRVNSMEIPMYPNLCSFGNTTSVAPLILNSTLAGSLEFFHIPFPDPGTYYVSIRVFYDNCQPCKCPEKCKKSLDDCALQCEIDCILNCNTCTEQCKSKVMKMKNCEICNCDSNCSKESDATKNISVIFAIASYPCVSGICGSKGICYYYSLGLFKFSSCKCIIGYRGWDCSDDSHALSDSEILVSIVLLTFSNLLFIPGIYFAIRYGYYSQGVTYVCSMITSTFYHACDSNYDKYGYCICPKFVLQFADFYCGLLTIWMTLIAMSYTTYRINSFCSLAGAIILAFSVTYNKHALWVFLLPSIIGTVIVGFSWGLQCWKTKNLFPAKQYLKFYLPVGGGLVFMGLFCFGFLQTAENYKIVHSLWHVMMALSLIFFLPNKEKFVPEV